MSRSRENADGARLDAPLASPALTGTPSVTLGSDATGDVYYRASGGGLTRLATGADGTVLTSTGAGSPPAFETISTVSGTLIKVDSYYSSASANWTKPAGCTQVVVYITGGGGGGGGAASGQTGAGGAAAGTVIIHVTNSSASAFNSITAGSGTVAYVVGALGAANSGANGGAGGVSWFGTDSANFYGKATGGNGGNANGVGTGNNSGTIGSSSYAPASSVITQGGMGTAEQGDGGSNVKTGGTGGASYYGSGGSGALENSGNGYSDGAIGSGGGGGSGSSSGGTGQAGAIIVYSYT